MYIEQKSTDEEICRVLKNRWIAPDNYNFPVSEKRNLKFQRNWLLEFTWLAYSQSSNGAFCQYCVFFCPKEPGKGKIKPKSLVNQPFQRWKDAKEVFRNHSELKYHRDSVIFGQNFLDVQNKKIVSISGRIDKFRAAEIKLNRQILSAIIETIIFIGRQEIASRGHRDSGAILLESPVENDGNFRSLLRFRMSAGDEILRNHLQTSKLRYTSPKVQNEIIQIIGENILDKIVPKINEAKYFSILADETTDISGIEQFSLCARYVDKVEEKMVLREDFLKFVPVQDVSGPGRDETECAFHSWSRLRWCQSHEWQISRRCC